MQLRRPLRRSLALTASAVVLTAPLLSSCGFDYATDRPYTPAAGTNNRDSTVDVLGAVIVAAHEGSGTFVAGLSNNSATEPVTLTAIEGADAIDLQVAAFTPVEIPPRGYVDLSGDDLDAHGTTPRRGIHVTGDVHAGDFVPLVLEFDNGEAVELEVPIYTNCDEFEGFDTSRAPAGAEEYSCETAEPAGEEGGH